ncbi:MAG TPA: sodium:solute symporter [Kofleriaceae bacterium]
MTGINWTALIVLAILFLIVAGMGFVAGSWRRPATMHHLDEWGLGGRNFGGWITWFLIGGDIYTAYTFVAVPALLFATGATGFFAMPYTVILYPIAFLPLIRLWSVSHRHGFVTPADFVRARFGSPTLALLVAITGIVATMPYIALQLVGIEAVLKTIGLTGDDFVTKHLPLIIAFGILAAYTYQSGLRAPALIAFVKDTLIYVVILVAVLWLPHALGGWAAIFDAANQKFTAAKRGSLLLPPGSQLQYLTLAFGSALALFLYPHSVTGILASKNRDIIKRNMAALPAYTLLLGLIALLGFMAIAAAPQGVAPIVTDGKPDTNTVIPVLFGKMFPSWFAGIAYAAIGIGALVPAAIMSIAAANLFTRNIYVEYLDQNSSHERQAQVSKVVSLVVKFGALLVILFIDPQFSIDLQLIGGVIILQTLPAVAIGLFTRWFHRGGLIAGWFAGMLAGMGMLYSIPNPVTHREHFGGSAFALAKLGLGTNLTIYTGFVAVTVNLIVTILVTLILRAAGVADGRDATERSDYFADEGDPKLTR